jgi:hypothetical protein
MMGRISVECDLGLDRYLSDVYELMFVPVDKLCSFKVEVMAVLMKRKREEGSAEGSWVRLVEGVARVEGRRVDGCLEVEVWMGFGKRSTSRLLIGAGEGGSRKGLVDSQEGTKYF